MNWSDYKFIKSCVVSHKSNALAIALGYEKGGRASIRGLITGNDNSRLYVSRNLTICRLLKSQGYVARSTNTIWDSIFFQKYFHPLCTHRLIIQCIRKNVRVGSNCFCFYVIVCTNSCSYRREIFRDHTKLL